MTGVHLQGGTYVSLCRNLCVVGVLHLSFLLNVPPTGLVQLHAPVQVLGDSQVSVLQLLEGLAPPKRPT